MKIGLDTYLARRHIHPRQDDTTSEKVMKTVEVSRGAFAFMYCCTAVVLAAGCVTILSWVVTGRPHPDWVEIRKPHPAIPHPPYSHTTLPRPMPPAGGDLIPPTDLPER